MQPFKNYDNAKVIGEFETLPKGNYVCKVMGVEEKTSQRGNTYYEISYDIAEGEYKGFFAKDYKNQKSENKKWRGVYMITQPNDNSPEWLMNILKTFVAALEDSNANYHWDWDEKKWKNLLFGAKMRYEEYTKDGKAKKALKMGGACPASKVRDGSAGLMKDKGLKGSSTSGSASTEEFMSIPDGEEEDLPFA